MGIISLMGCHINYKWCDEFQFTKPIYEVEIYLFVILRKFESLVKEPELHENWNDVHKRFDIFDHSITRPQILFQDMAMTTIPSPCLSPMCHTQIFPFFFIFWNK